VSGVKVKVPRPRGRPPGAKNRKTMAKEQAIDRCIREASAYMCLEALDIVKAMAAKAKKGDTTAAKLILDRVIPARRSIDELPDKHPVIEINITQAEIPNGYTIHQEPGTEDHAPIPGADGEGGQRSASADVLALVRGSEG